MIGTTSSTINTVKCGAIEAINSKFPVELGKFSISDEDSVLSVEFSPQGGNLLAGVSLSGQVKIWQVSAKSERTNWPLLRILRDAEEENIDEFFTGAFLPNGHFVTAGKRKQRHHWDDMKEEAQNLPGLLKIFDLKTGNCIKKLGLNDFSDTENRGHVDEILYLKPISTRQGNFIISCGQDGQICRWSFSEDWNTFLEKVEVIKMGNLAFHFDQMSDELIAVAVDNGLIIYDILNLKHLRAFKTGFTSYCDFVKVLKRIGTKFHFILRGVELLKKDTQQPSASNSIIVTEVDLAEATGAKIINRLKHPLYNANSWLIKPATTQNGEYLAAPTITGRILIFNLRSGQMTANFHCHDDSEVRQVTFHPKLPIMVSCGDDGRIRIYYQMINTCNSNKTM